MMTSVRADFGYYFASFYWNPDGRNSFFIGTGFLEMIAQANESLVSYK